MSKENIRKKLIETKKVKYYIDKDGINRTTNCRHLMSKKDIVIIFDLYAQKKSVFKISKQKNIKYDRRRIKKLI